MARPVLLLLAAVLAFAVAYAYADSIAESPKADGPMPSTPISDADGPTTSTPTPDADGPMPSSLIPIDTTPLPASEEGEKTMNDYGAGSLGSPLGTTMRNPEPDQSEKEDDKKEKSAATASFDRVATSVGVVAGATVAGYLVL